MADGIRSGQGTYVGIVTVDRAEQHWKAQFEMVPREVGRTTLTRREFPTTTRATRHYQQQPMLHRASSLISDLTYATFPHIHAYIQSFIHRVSSDDTLWYRNSGVSREPSTALHQVRVLTVECIRSEEGDGPERNKTTT